eukprot:990462-Pelagomonas_calceolata.AAC.2
MVGSPFAMDARFPWEWIALLQVAARLSPFGVLIATHPLLRAHPASTPYIISIPISLSATTPFSVVDTSWIKSNLLLLQVAAAHAALQHQGAWAEQLCLENTSVAEGQQQQQQQQQLQGLGPWTQLPPQQATLEQLQVTLGTHACNRQTSHAHLRVGASATFVARGQDHTLELPHVSPFFDALRGKLPVCLKHLFLANAGGGLAPSMHCTTITDSVIKGSSGAPCPPHQGPLVAPTSSSRDPDPCRFRFQHAASPPSPLVLIWCSSASTLQTILCIIPKPKQRLFVHCHCMLNVHPAGQEGAAGLPGAAGCRHSPAPGRLCPRLRITLPPTPSPPRARRSACPHLRPTPGRPPHEPRHRACSHALAASSAIAPQHATSVCWASQSSWLALTASRLDLEDLAQDAVALAAGSGSNVASEVCGVPGMAELAAQLHAAAAQAVAWEAEITGARGVMAPRHSGATNDNTTTTPAAPSTQPLPALPNNGAAAAEADAFSKDMEAAVSAVLIWAQGLDAAAKSAPQETPVRDAAAAAAGGGDAASAAAGGVSSKALFPFEHFCLQQLVKCHSLLN